MTTYYVAAPVLGSELFGNPDFTTTGTWTLGGGWSINTTTGECEGTSTTGNVSQALGLTVGKRYRVSVNVTSYTGGSYFYLMIDGSVILTTVYQAGQGAGVFTGYGYSTLGTGHSGFFDGTGVTANLTSLSCKEVVIGGDGTVGDPWQGAVSINNTNTLVPGDTVIFIEDQDYDGMVLDTISGSAGSPITFQRLAGVKFTRANDGHTYVVPNILLDTCSYITLDGLHIEGNHQSGDFVPGLASRANGIDLTSSSNIIIQNCTIANTYGRAIISTDSGSSDIKILNNTCYNNPVGGLSLSVATTSRWDTQIVGNTIYNNGNEPQDVNGDGNAMHANCPDMLVAYNYIEYNGDPNTTVGTAEDFEISCDGNQGGGTGVNAYNISIYGNYIKNAITGGIQIFENCYGCTVAYNIVDGFNQAALTTGTYGIAAGLRIGTQSATSLDESNTLVYNNIFHNNEAAATAGAVSPCILIGHESGGAADQSGCKFYNNIFLNCAGMFWFIDDLADISGIEIDYNIYWNDNGIYASNAWHCGQLTGGDTYSTFSAWQATAATALSSPDANGMNVDPKLNGLFKPSADSPAYHAGKYVGNYKDQNERVASIPPTIGAFEFTSGFPAQTRAASLTRTAASRTAAGTRTARS